jgi:DNA modification methylase
MSSLQSRLRDFRRPQLSGAVSYLWIGVELAGSFWSRQMTKSAGSAQRRRRRAMRAVIKGNAAWYVTLGDCRRRLKDVPDDSIDAVVTDPPAGISFMGKEWDRYHKEGHSELEAFQDFIAEVFTEIYRVLKPGGYTLVWAIPRTDHHTTMGVERAGLEVRDKISHLFGSGFPKSHDVSKAIDKAAGAKRKRIKGTKSGGMSSLNAGNAKHGYRDQAYYDDGNRMISNEPVTKAARRWRGWGTALKPAVEFWILARKPLEGTVAANVLKHGVGGLNIDGTRIGAEKRHNSPASTTRVQTMGRPDGVGSGWRDDYGGKTVSGRWPANLVLSHSPGCNVVGRRVEKRVSGQPAGSTGKGGIYGNPGTDSVGRTSAGARNKARGLGRGVDVTTKHEVWACVPGCAVRALDEQSGEVKAGTSTSKKAGTGYGGNYGPQPPTVSYGDSGGASRFFYVAKAPTREKWGAVTCGCQHKPSDISVVPAKTKVKGRCQECGERRRLEVHPTVKSISLMRWLCRLVTPPGGVVLDAFTGSGSTGVAALAEGFRFLGIEKQPVYVAINRRRVGDAAVEAERRARRRKKRALRKAKARVDQPFSED